MRVAVMSAFIITSSRVRCAAGARFESPMSLFKRAFSSESGDYFTVGITGSSGMVGSALIDQLNKVQQVNGKPVRIMKMIRSNTISSPDISKDDSVVSVSWNPNGESSESVIDPSVLEELDAIVHLAGENVATGLGPLGFLGIRPWTSAKKSMILSSRVVPTKGLAKAVAASNTPITFICASGIGAYGSDFIGTESVAADESSDTSKTSGFLADISRQWEAATKDAEGQNRIVNARFGVILSKMGGALSKLYPIFFLGGGGILGSGQQNFSYMSARDAARALVHTLETPSLKGPVNFCTPNPCTNSEFTSAFGKILGRPTIIPFPGFAMSLMYGEMGDEMLLGGTKAIPTRLMKSGFEFNHPMIEDALKSAVDETI